jgi:hypothetical protein
MIDALVRAMARRCGLEDPTAFAGIVRVQCGSDRGTGRTKSMLLRALVALEVGCTVEIVAADEDQAKDLAKRARKLSAAAGVSLARLRTTWPGAGVVIERGGESHRLMRGSDGLLAPDVRLVDHYAAERGAN